MVDLILPPLPIIEGVEIRHIPGRIGYAVTNTGDIYSARRHKSTTGQWHKLKPTCARGLYQFVITRANGRASLIFLLYAAYSRAE